MGTDALFSLFSPVQNILFQNQPSTAWHGAQAQTKTMPEGKGARRGAEVAEKDCMAHLLSCFFSALSALSARNKILANRRDADGFQYRLTQIFPRRVFHHEGREDHEENSP
jgi:hypothetical protein